MENVKSSLSPNSKVADFVINNPLTAKVFHQNDIDFCCGGQVSIEEACSEKGLDSNSILSQIEELEKSPSEFEVTENTRATEVVDYIQKRFHDTLKEEIPTLAFLMDKVSRVHGRQHPFLNTLRDLFMALLTDLEPHMQKEEAVLFPLIKDLDSSNLNHQSLKPAHCGSVQNPINQMEIEHGAVGTILKEMRTVTNGYTLPEDACNSFRGLYAGLEKMEVDLHLHIHMENNILHPMAIKLE